MGGFGSGRPSGYGRSRVESCRSIDVNRLNREGCLNPGWRGGWQWNSDGETVGSISLRTEQGRLVLSYNYRRDGGEWQSVEEPVPIIRVPCRFGGARPYFLCPGVVNGVPCGRRVAKLYGPGIYFLCRHCYRLAYASQSEGTWDRARRRANKIRTQLGGNPGVCSPFPERPKGMWQKTYERLRGEALEAEELADAFFVMRAARLLGRLEGSNRRKGFWQ